MRRLAMARLSRKLTASSVAAIVYLALLGGALAQIRVCVDKTAAELGDTCTGALNNAAGKPATITFSCVAGKATATEPDTCLQKIKDDEADLSYAIPGPRLIAEADDEHVLPAIQEVYGGGSDIESYSVAVVRKEFCDTPEVPQQELRPNFYDLKGKKMCSDGYRQAAGWNNAVGYLIMKGVLTVQNEESNIYKNDAYAAAQFFSDICAPGVREGGPEMDPNTKAAKSYDRLCGLCQNDCTRTRPGRALECLAKEDKDTVAFTTHKDVLASANKDQYMLLCPSGGCVTPDKYQQCHMGRTAAHAMVARKNWRTGRGKAMLDWVASNTGVFTTAAKSAGLLPSPQVTNVRVVTEGFAEYFGVEELDIADTLNRIETKPILARVCMHWGVPEDRAEQIYSHCTRLLNKKGDMPGNTDPNVAFTCVGGKLGFAPSTCMGLIDHGFADLMVGGTDDMYYAKWKFSILPMVGEADDDSGNPSPDFYSVAVVKKDFCDARQGKVLLRDLKGLNTCHTGYRKPDGWTLPMGYMLKEGLIADKDELDDVHVDAESVAAHFGNVCAPRITGDGPRYTIVNGQKEAEKFKELCNGCAGDCSGSAAEPYYEAGVLSCLRNETMHVGFMSHEHVMNLTDVEKEQFALICPSGVCSPIPEGQNPEAYKDCNLGAAPGRAILANKGYEATWHGQQVVDLLSKLDSGEIVELKGAGGGGHSFLFSPTAGGVVKVNPATYMSPEMVGAYEAINYEGGVRDRLPNTLRYCTVSDEEMAFCTRAMAILNQEDTAGRNWNCVKFNSTRECMVAIENNEAEWRTMDAGEIYEAHHEFGLRVVMAEKYGEIEDDLEYYAVAVVRRGMCKPGFSIDNLQGQRMCSTGYMRPAGWQMPMGKLLQSGFMPLVSKRDDVEDSAESAAAWFGGVCAPRTTANGPMLMPDGLGFKGAKWDQMCTNCAGDCSDTSEEPYRDFDGALRCLFENKGDVAFVKHTTALTYAKDGAAPALDWKHMYSTEELRLMCPAGGCAEIGNFANCNFARVPARAVVTNEVWTVPHVERFQDALAKAILVPEFANMVFASESNPENYVFRAETQDLIPITVSSSKYLGTSLSVYYYLYNLAKSQDEAIRAKQEKAKCDGKISRGSAAGLAIGFLLLGALLTICAIAIIRRLRDRRQGFKKWDDGHHNGVQMGHKV